MVKENQLIEAASSGSLIKVEVRLKVTRENHKGVKQTARLCYKKSSWYAYCRVECVVRFAIKLHQSHASSASNYTNSIHMHTHAH